MPTCTSFCALSTGVVLNFRGQALQKNLFEDFDVCVGIGFVD